MTPNYGITVREDLQEPELPSFCGYQAVEKVDVTHGLDFYVDEDGDLWTARGDEKTGDGCSHLWPREVRKILRSMEAQADE